MGKNDKGNEENEKCNGKPFRKPLKLFRDQTEWKFLPGKGFITCNGNENFPELTLPNI